MLLPATPAAGAAPLPLGLPGGAALKLHKPSSCDELYEWYADCGNVDADPFWGDVWPAGAALASEVVASRCCEGKRVAELGAGLGVVGVAAALHGGAEDVVLLDYEPAALHCALLGAVSSGAAVTDAGEGGSSDGSVAAESGASASSSDVAGVAAAGAGALCSRRSGGRVRAEVFDWTLEADVREPFDVVAMSDVLYDPEGVGPLEEAVLLLLGLERAPDGSLAGPARGDKLLVVGDRAERTQRARFADAMRAAGARVAERPVDVPAGARAAAGGLAAEPVVILEARWDGSRAARGGDAA
eukprot:PRCOL_00000837-RA